MIYSLYEVSFMDGGDFALAILCFFATIGMSYMLMSVIVR